jgi:hypothetical protein
MSEDQEVQNVNQQTHEGIPVPRDPHAVVAQLKAEQNESPESFAQRRYEAFNAVLGENNRDVRGTPKFGIPWKSLPGKIQKEWIEGARKYLERTQTPSNRYARKFKTKAEALIEKRGIRRVPQ